MFDPSPRCRPAFLSSPTSNHHCECPFIMRKSTSTQKHKRDGRKRASKLNGPPSGVTPQSWSPSRKASMLASHVAGVSMGIDAMFSRTFWSSGAVARMSFIRMGISSVTLCTPAANVPSGAERLGVCPWALAWSNHFLVTESTT